MKRTIVPFGVLAAALLLSACYGRPWPTVAARIDPHVVLMVGDSLVGQTDYSLSNVLADRGFTDTTVIDAHVNGTGLIGPVPYTAPDGTVTTFASALAWMQHNLELHPEVDTVVIEYVGACAVCGLWIQGVPVFGSDDFYRQWVANGDAMIDAARAAGKQVLYTISPSSGASGNPTVASGSQFRTDVARGLSLLDRAVFCARADGCVDWWDPLVDVNGAYQTFLFYDATWHKVRNDDLVHLELDGSVRTATWTAAALGSTWSDERARALAAPNDLPPGLMQAGDPVTLGGGAP